MWSVLALLITAWCVYGDVGSDNLQRSSGKCAFPRAKYHGIVTVTGLEPGDRAHYSCSPGFSLLGPSYAVCSEEGQWSSLPPSCIGRRCPSLPYISHGSMVYSYGRGKVAFKCVEGYVISGEAELFCVDGYNWNGTSPTCIEDISSGEITTTSRPKSDAEKSHDDWLQEADYSCVTRSGSVPTPEVANASSTVSWADVGGEARLFVIYRCKWDFDFVGHSQHMYCQNGKWIGVLPECQPFFVKTLEKEEVNKREQELKKEETDSGQKGRAPSLRDEARRGTHEEMLLKSDYSCLAEKREVMPPVLPHARSNLRFMSLEGQPRLYVQYRCNRIARMSERTEVPFMYCQNGTWVGEVPVCVLRDSRQQLTTLPPDPCSVNNGGCEHECVDEAGVARCRCQPGFRPSGRTGNHCEDINECHDFNGRCAHRCRNTIGSYQCECYRDFTLSVDKHSCVMDSRSHYRRPYYQRRHSRNWQRSPTSRFFKY